MNRSRCHPLLLFAGVSELELGVAQPGPGIFGGAGRRAGLEAVGLADEMDETLAGVDLFAQDIAEVARFGAEDFLKDRFVAEELEHLGDLGAGAAEFGADAGNEDARFVHVSTGF